MLRHSDLPGCTSTTHQNALPPISDSSGSRKLNGARLLLARTLAGASLVSVLTLAPAATPVTAIVHTAPAAAFALAGASAINSAVGGVDESGSAFSTQTTTATTARVAVEVANVRSGPGLDYDKVGKLPSGVIVTLIERKADWFKVRSPAGATGWMTQEALAMDEAAAAEVITSKSTPAAPAALQAVTSRANVHLRRGPGKEFASLGKLPKGLSLDLLGRQNSWYRVQTPAGALGWVTADYLQIPSGVVDRVPADAAVVGSGPAAPARAAAVPSVPTGVVSGGKSNLRAGPGTAFASLGQLTRNTTLTLVARHGDWLKVRTSKGTLGWISGALLDVSAATLRSVPVTNDVPAAPVKAAPAPAAATSNRWVWPARGRLTSGYGRRWGVLHNGVDIANRKWTPIMAARAGTVIEAGWCSGYGYCVRIAHGDGFVTEYGHLAAQPRVRRGQRVGAGTLIGSMGSTYDRRGGGYSTGVHLHFTVKRYGLAVNPLKYLP